MLKGFLSRQKSRFFDFPEGRRLSQCSSVHWPHSRSRIPPSSPQLCCFLSPPPCPRHVFLLDPRVRNGRGLDGTRGEMCEQASPWGLFQHISIQLTCQDRGEEEEVAAGEGSPLLGCWPPGSPTHGIMGPGTGDALAGLRASCEFYLLSQPRTTEQTQRL